MRRPHSPSHPLRGGCLTSALRTTFLTIRGKDRDNKGAANTGDTRANLVKSTNKTPSKGKDNDKNDNKGKHQGFTQGKHKGRH